MDYIREELLRQRAALARLLSGGGAAGEMTREDLPTDREIPETAFALRRQSGKSGWTEREAAADSQSLGLPEMAAQWTAEETRLRGGQGTAEEPVGAGAVWLAEDGAWLTDGNGVDWQALTEAMPETAALAGWNGATGRAEESGEEADESGGTVSGSGMAPRARRRLLLEGGTVRERSVTEMVWPSTVETAGPQALSRAFQRDARRYDGGFGLY